MAYLKTVFVVSSFVVAVALIINIRESFIFRSLGNRQSQRFQQKKLLLIVLDGLRWDTFGLDLPHLSKVSHDGVKATWMNGVFPTLSMPSMYSIATGLYTESHGLIHNVYFDRVTKNRIFEFAKTCNMTEWFDNGAEPIWVTAILQGLKAGTIMYPGGSVPIKGVRPHKNMPYVRSLESNLTDQINTAVSWFTEDNFDMVALFFQDPDEWLHEFGIVHQEFSNKLYEVDSAIGYLLDQIQEHELEDTLDVIIVSDHGMIDVDEQQYVNLLDHIDEEDIELMIGEYGMFFLLEPKPGKVDKVYNKLSTAHPSLHIFKKDDIPERYHYGKNDKVLSIIGFIDPGWHLYTKLPLNYKVTPAGHGYDNHVMSMKSVFYAKGPHFRKNFVSPPLESVDIYQMMCEILSLDQAPNNGSRLRYADMMASSDPILSS